MRANNPQKPSALKKVSHDLAFLIAVQNTSVELLARGSNLEKVSKLSTDLLKKLKELKKLVDDENAGGAQ